MLLRLFPIKDTFITNVQKNRIQQTGSNFGAAESLDVFKIAGTSGAIGVAGTASLSRALLKFDLTNFLSITSSNPSYYLRLRHVTTAETLPTSFDIVAHPVAVDWDEGRGIDVVSYLDKGVANWVKAKSTVFWSAGSDYSSSLSASCHFDDGFEDFEADVTSIVNAWLTGGLQNNGFVLKLSDALESNSDYSDYYIKRFNSRTSNFKDRRPYLEARYSDWRADDRGRMKWNKTGSLFLYNTVAGQLVSPGASMTVRIADASGTLLTTTGVQVSPGIFSASFALPTGSIYSGSVFYDLWSIGSTAYMTGTFLFENEPAQTTLQQHSYRTIVKNLSNEYEPDDETKLTVFFTDRTYRPTVVLTGSTVFKPNILTNVFYAIENDSTRERVIPFDTGSTESTRVSYDENGNYFSLRMSNLHSGNVYRILFLVINDGQRQIVDCDHKFKVS